METVYGLPSNAEFSSISYIVVLVAFISPLLIAAYRELDKSRGRRLSRKRKSSFVNPLEFPDDFAVDGSVPEDTKIGYKNEIIWVGMCVTSYCILRCFLQWFECKRNLKPVYEHKNHVLTGCVLQGLVLYYSGLKSLIIDHGPSKIVTKVTYMTIIYSILFEMDKGMDLSLSTNHILSETKYYGIFQALIRIGLVFSLIFIVLYLQPKHTRKKLALCIGVVLFVHVSLMAPLASKSSFHLHHSWWSFLLSSALSISRGGRLTDENSTISWANFMCVGIWIHGISAFGVENAFGPR